MKLVEIAKLLGASHMLNDRLSGTVPAGFSIDSRSIRPGDLFIAIPGEHVDGHKFVNEVFEKGACTAIVVHKRLPFATDLGEMAFKLLFVEDTTAAIGQMSSRVLERWGRPIVAITGSAGKTTMKDLTARVLSASFRVMKSPGNLNTSYGLPLTVSQMITGGSSPEDFDCAVLEMGMSSFGEIAHLTDLAPPHIGVVGNVGTAHIEFFGTQDLIARAKAEMVDGIRPGGTAVLNADDSRVMRMRERRNDIEVVTFGIESNADCMAREIEVEGDLSGTRFILRTPAGEAQVRLSLIGRHNVLNALAASACGHACGLSVDVIAEQLGQATATKMRGELIGFANGMTVIDDSYNSNPQALIESVRAMSSAKGFRRRIVVAGEMLELGASGAEMHRQCGREIAALKIDRLIGVRGLAGELVAGAIEAGMNGDRATFSPTSDEAADELISEAGEGDLVLVKGSRGVRTERVIEKLKSRFDQRSNSKT